MGFVDWQLEQIQRAAEAANTRLIISFLTALWFAPLTTLLPAYTESVIRRRRQALCQAGTACKLHFQSSRSSKT